MSDPATWADVLIKVDSEYHRRALTAQIGLCSRRLTEEKKLKNSRILRGIASALDMLLDKPDRGAYLMSLRLQASKSVTPPLTVNEIEEVMHVIVTLTSDKARQLAISTRGKKVWPSSS